MTRATVVALRRVLLAVFLTSVIAPTADAQAPARPYRPRVEVGVDVMGGSSVSFGDSSADLVTGEGAGVPLFRTRNSSGPEWGSAVRLEMRLSRRLSIEVAGRWSRADLRSRVSGDLEGAETALLILPMSRLSGELSGLVAFGQRPRGSWFVLAGGGRTRERAGASTLVEQGTVANLGVGMKYYWRHRAGGRLSHIGIRLEGHAAMRWNSITLGPDTVHVAPVISGGLILGL